MKYTKSKKYEYVYSYDTKSGKKWTYRYKYYNSFGERKEATKSGFTSEKSAYKELLQVQVKNIDGKTKELDNSNIKVSRWMDTWYQTYEADWKKNTQVQRKNIVYNIIIPTIGNHTLQKLNVATYKRVFINELLKKYKPSTVDLIHTIFKISMNAAVNNEIIDKNRFSSVSIAQTKNEENYLDQHQLNQLLKIAKETENLTTYTLVLLLAYSGMRLGEALGLTEEDVSFEENLVSIIRTRDGHGVHTPKTHRSIRKIKLDLLVMKQLKKYLFWVKKEKFRLGMIHRPTDFIFCSYQSMGPLSPNSTSYLFKRLCQRAGIKHITPHGLRHTHATLLLKDGSPVISVAKRLGNTPDMINNIYGHVLDSMEDDLVSTFSDSLKTSHNQ